MADVFISYHVKSAAPVVRQISQQLEADGITCWYSDRDMQPGEDFAEKVPSEIRKCNVFLLIADSGAAKSHHVQNELAIAFNRQDEITIIPFYLQKCKSEWMDYYLTHIQKMNRLAIPLEQRIEELVSRIADIVGKSHKKRTPQKKETPLFRVVQSLIKRLLELAKGLRKANIRRFLSMAFVFLGKLALKALFCMATLLLIGGCSMFLFLMMFMTYVSKGLGPALEVDPSDYTIKQTSIIYYHDDAIEENDGWIEYKTVYGDENRILVRFDQIAPAMWQAVVAQEDFRFFEHRGVDWRETFSAIGDYFSGRNISRNSSITQQMLQMLTGRRENTVNRKVLEMFRALEFEKNHTKAEVLELYLNLLPFGNDCYGVQTAAQYYFGKNPADLSVAECASLAAIIDDCELYCPVPNRNIYAAVKQGTIETAVTSRQLNKERQELALKRMYKSDLGLQFLTREEYEAAVNEELHLVEERPEWKYNERFVNQILQDVTDSLVLNYGIEEETAIEWIRHRGYHIYASLTPEEWERSAPNPWKRLFIRVLDSRGYSVLESALSDKYLS